MVNIYRSTIITAPIDTVWQVICDFNAHAQWHPAIATSTIEQQKTPNQIGAVRNFSLTNQQKVREQLLHLCHKHHTYTYTIVDSDIPLFHYIATVKLYPVTDQNHTFWVWQSTFETPNGQQTPLAETVATTIYEAGFEAVRNLIKTS